MPSWRGDPSAGPLLTQVLAPSFCRCSVWLSPQSFADWRLCWPVLTHALTFHSLPLPPCSFSHCTHCMYMYSHHWETFNSLCLSENNWLVFLIFIVWVSKFTGVELERHILCVEVANVMFLKLKWVVFTALGCTRCFYTSDRLSQRLQLCFFFSFPCVLCIWCGVLRRDKTKCVENCDDCQTLYLVACSVLECHLI